MMKVRCWGVRGSIPTPGPTTVAFGGNTACISLEVDGRILIFDAGSGIRECGGSLLGRPRPLKAEVFISHTHWDHIQGFPFFVPAYIPGNEFNVYGPPSDVQNLSIRQIMEMQTNYEFFPVRVAQLGATINYIDCAEGRLPVAGLEVYACKLNHPVSCFAFKVISEGKTFVYGGDHEPFRNLYRDSAGDAELDEEMLEEFDQTVAEQNGKILEFCRGADLVTWDAQYTDEEYATKHGWGHSPYSADLELAAKAGIKHLLCTHHDPLSPDPKLAEAETRLRAAAQASGLRLDFAREGMQVEL